MKKLTLSLLAAFGIIASAIAYADALNMDQDTGIQKIDIESPDEGSTMGGKCPPFC